jgi:hypothetical protein
MGLNTSLGQLAKSPQDAYAGMVAGNDPYYNVLQQNNARVLKDQQAQAALYGQQTGLTNSTTLGSEMGRIQNDDNLRQQNNLASALTFGSDQARQNAATQQGTLTSLANLSYPLASGANSNLTTGLGAQDAASQFNTGNQQQVNLANQQAQIQANAQRSAMIGNLINGAATIAGGALGGPLGASLGGSLSKAATGAFGLGGGGGSSGGLGGGAGVPSLMTTFGSGLV